MTPILSLPQYVKYNLFVPELTLGADVFRLEHLWQLVSQGRHFEVLPLTQEITVLDLALLETREEKLSFYGNLSNLMSLHAAIHIVEEAMEQQVGGDGQIQGEERARYRGRRWPDTRGRRWPDTGGGGGQIQGGGGGGGGGGERWPYTGGGGGQIQERRWPVWGEVVRYSGRRWSDGGGGGGGGANTGGGGGQIKGDEMARYRGRRWSDTGGDGQIQGEMAKYSR